MDRRAEIDSAGVGTGPILKTDYLRWAVSSDLAVQARAYRLSQQHWGRIIPSPDMAEQCAFMADYLLRCIRADRKNDDVIHSGFEAGHELADWLTHLVKSPGTQPVIADVATRLGDLFKNSDAATRIRIETATLEHALEVPALRPFFESWSLDPMLCNAFEAARAWGEAHENGTG